MAKSIKPIKPSPEAVRVAAPKSWMVGRSPIVIRCTTLAECVFQLLTPTDPDAEIMEFRTETITIASQHPVIRKVAFVRAILYTGASRPGRLPDDWRRFTTPRVVWFGLILQPRSELIQHLGSTKPKRLSRYFRDECGAQVGRSPLAYIISTTGDGVYMRSHLQLLDVPLTRTPKLDALVYQAASLLTVDRLPGKAD